MDRSGEGISREKGGEKKPFIIECHGSLVQFLMWTICVGGKARDQILRRSSAGSVENCGGFDIVFKI